MMQKPRTAKKSKAELKKALDAMSPTLKATVLAAAKKKHLQKRLMPSETGKGLD